MLRFVTLLHRIRPVLLAVAALVLLVPSVLAQQQAPLVGIDPIRASIDQIEAAARRGGLSVRALYDFGLVLGPQREALRAKLADLEPRLADVDERLKGLGPAPAKDAPAESPQVAAERARLVQLRSELDSAVKQVQLLQVRAEQLATVLSDRRRAAYTETLFERTPNVLDPYFWGKVGAALADEAGRAVGLAKDWWALVQSHGGYTRLLMVDLVLAGLLVLSIGLLRWWRRAALIARAETRFGKELAALLVFCRAFVVAPLAVLIIVELLQQFDLMMEAHARFAGALVLGTAIATLARASALSVLAPDQPQLRLVAFDDALARSLFTHLTWAGRVLGALVIVRAFHRTIAGPQVISDALKIISPLIIGAILFHLLMERRSADEEAGDVPQRRIPGVRLLAWLVVFAIVVSLLTGYGGFASFVAARLVFTITLIATLYLLLVVTDALIASTLSQDTRRGQTIARQLGVNPRRLALLGTVLSGVVRALFVLVVLALAVGRWEVAAADFFDALRNATFGIKIGDLTISVGAVVGAIVLFAIVLLLTRVVQRWLEREVLPRTEIDPSLRLSIATVFGYVGFIIAFVLALAELGIDLQKIAFVAGALSVGIGFGLQSIVSNFVSGLILMAERPIRVGDLINVKGEEGHVRKISVRATEIETAERGSVIVPNSELITGVVKNYTHANMLGRTVIKVGVGYDCDPAQVREILLACAADHAQVLKTPEPACMIVAFGENALQFELYCIIGNLGNAGSVKSDLYFAILKRFREAGIEIPYPQRDVRVRRIADTGDSDKDA